MELQAPAQVTHQVWWRSVVTRTWQQQVGLGQQRAAGTSSCRTGGWKPSKQHWRRCRPCCQPSMTAAVPRLSRALPPHHVPQQQPLLLHPAALHKQALHQL
jgi:hypothetical protein